MKNKLKRIPVLLFILPVIVAFQSVQAQQTYLHTLPLIHSETQTDPHLSKTFQMRGIPDLRVNIPGGDIEVEHIENTDKVDVELYTKRSFSLWSGTRSLDTYRIIVQQRGDQIIASVEDRRPGRTSRGGDIDFRFVIRVPAQASSNLRTINGEILLSGVNGEHFLQNQTGDLRVKNSEGDIRITSTTGNIYLNDVHGNIFAKTVNGRIEANRNQGEVRLRTVAGNIKAEELSGTLVSGSTSGNIEAHFSDVSIGIHMETVSGNIELDIPRTTGYTVSGKAMRFNFDGIDSSSIKRRSVSSRNANVVIRDGDIPVNLSTVSGRISVREND